MDKLTIKRIKEAHPSIREALHNHYIEINNRLPVGVRLRFSSVYRTGEEQHKLYLKRPRVTQADAGQSIHNYGLAFDIVLLFDLDGNGSFETASWDKDNKYWVEVVNYFKAKGWQWGGDWKNFKDYPHFQKSFGHTWRTLQELPTLEDPLTGITYPILDNYGYLTL